MRKTILLFTAVAALGACSQKEVTNAGIGSAIGIAGAIVIDGDPLAGAIVGAAGGLLYGRL